MSNLWQAGQDSIWKLGAFDKLFWDQACAVFKEADMSGSDNPLQSAEEFISKKIGGGRLIHDLFQLLHKRDIEQKAHTPANLAPVKTLVDMALNMDDLEAIKQTTVGNKLEAALAARDLATRLSDKMPKPLKDQAKRIEKEQEKLAAAEIALDEALEMYDNRIDEIQGNGESVEDYDTTEADELIEKLRQLIEDRQGEVDEALGAYEEIETGSQGAVGLAVKGAVEETDEALDNIMTFVKAFSRTAGGNVDQGIDLEMLKWARQAVQNAPAMQDFSELLGWGQRIMRGLRRESLKATTEPAGIKAKTYNPQTVVMTEQVGLMGGYGKALQVEARTRLAEEKILHYHKEGGEDVEGLGDVIFLQDVSGSMSQREVQTILAISWGMIEACRKDDRGFTAIQFAGYRQWDAWTMPREGEAADPEGLYKSLTRKFSGGTEPYQPLEHALDLVINGDSNADIVIFTDGVFGQPTQEVLGKIDESKAKTSTRIFTVNSGGGTNAQAEKFSDLCLYVEDLYGSREKLIELMKKIV